MTFIWVWNPSAMLLLRVKRHMVAISSCYVWSVSPRVTHDEELPPRKALMALSRRGCGGGLFASAVLLQEQAPELRLEAIALCRIEIVVTTSHAPARYLPIRGLCSASLPTPVPSSPTPYCTPFVCAARGTSWHSLPAGEEVLVNGEEPGKCALFLWAASSRRES
jgi:hypothetical protein